MRQLYRKKVVFCGIFVITLIIFIYPNINTLHTYKYIQRKNILMNLLEETAVNFTSRASIDCDYQDLVYDESTLSDSLVDGDLIEGHKIKNGGEYAPLNCKPKYSTAIIIPYRDRAEQLRGFLVYMHTYFRRQRIHYRIFVIEQIDSSPFNRGLLMNIGAEIAIKNGYPCLILHDVDLLPLRPANLYACTKSPRHMSSSTDKFRFIAPYLRPFGGAIAIATKQYQMVNGMSNEFFGWQGEDDDFYSRLEVKGLKVCRFETEISLYHVMPHKSVTNLNQPYKNVKFSESNMETNGLKSSTLYYDLVLVLHPLFTHIMAVF